VSEEAGGSAHTALCLRLMQLFPRVSRGMRRWQDRAAPQTPAPLGPRRVAALQQLRGGPVSVSELAARLDLTLPTVSGVMADLDRAGAAGPLARVLDKLAPSEQAAFLKAMDLLETELRGQENQC
jgi:DNA-binding transcriptional ArsR family regulator